MTSRQQNTQIVQHTLDLSLLEIYNQSDNHLASGGNSQYLEGSGVASRYKDILD